ncbi:hypothetical protein [Bosea lathyri]|jgi:hypothetical protein|uniref:Uncharacterized protein n=1 Tax=Bosea lathyri TaxID=1036778 RepID=A0A1H6C7Q9_9HYPH|nr:hypothetical protein [Bosea lathyri]SEG68948.1 hypothetical protein SAMN04488115_109101 [Bosea lathyri]
MTTPIPSLDEYEVATERVRNLADREEGTPPAAELVELVSALMKWDMARDEATAWKV